ncbi:hypothetical protein ABW19_dt0204874 [Dactylella cylindrospora]|nr:hypothetical protein ABW19_dt0204874 [Dactylella cylindrospora]
MSRSSTISRLPDSPESLSPSPSSQPANWSSLLKPLSAFPTPPDSIETETWELEPESYTKKSPLIIPTWQTPTITASTAFLTSLLPPSCRTPKSSIIIQQCLHRGQHLFTPYTIAMAGCILDALSSKFCHNLLQNPIIPRIRPTSHISSSDTGNVGELIISTALLIATKFLNDRPPHNVHFAVHIYDNVFSANVLTATERCMLDDVNYRLGYLCAEGVVGEKMGKLEKAVKEQRRKEGVDDDWEELEFELELDVEDMRDDVVDESGMLAVFEMDGEVFDYDGDD